MIPALSQSSYRSALWSLNKRCPTSSSATPPPGCPATHRLHLVDEQIWPVLPHILFFQLPSLLRALARLLPHFQAANDGCFIQATFQFQSASGCPFPLVIKKSGENWRLCTPKSLQPTIPATSDPKRPHKFGGTRQRESDVSMGPQRARRSCPHVHAARPVRSRSCPYALCSVLSAGGGPQQSSCVLSRTAYWSSQVLLRCTPY